MLTMMKSLPSDCVFSEMDSPIGRLSIIASELGLHAILFDRDRVEYSCETIIQSLNHSVKHPMMDLTRKQLTEYFCGERFDFSIPLILDGTPFQKKAWAQLLEVPYGVTISYAEQARGLGDHKKARAVGSANARNPISIIVPCHRVIAANGQLNGYGGGLENKQVLIDLEAGAKHALDSASDKKNILKNMSISEELNQWN